MSTEKQFDTIIIGGGIAGLTAGACLSKMGKKVLLLEKHILPGGFATSFKRKEYVIEVGLHILDGCFDNDFKKEIFHFLDIQNKLVLEKTPTLYHVSSKKYAFTLPNDWEGTYQKLLHAFPQEKKGIENYFSTLKHIFNEQMELLKKNIQPFIGPLFANDFPHISSASSISTGDFLDTHIKTDELKQILLAHLLYYGDDPYQVSLYFFAVSQASLLQGGGYFIQGGSQKLSDHLVSVIRENGGQVLLGKMVHRILMAEEKACGVGFTDLFNPHWGSTEVYADSIIANTALPLVTNLLPENLKSSFSKTLPTSQPSSSLLCIYMGFRKPLKTLGVENYFTYFVGDNVVSLDDLQKNLKGTWSQKSFSLIDYSQIDAKLAPPNKSVAILCTTDHWSEWENLDAGSYAKKKEAIAQNFFQRLESIYPNILDELEYYQVGTAKTIEKFTKNPQGSAYGFYPGVLQAAKPQTHYATSIQGLFAASAWTFPGGGFTNVLIAGYGCAQQVFRYTQDCAKKTDDAIHDNRCVHFLHKKKVAKETFELTFEKPVGFHFKPGQSAVLRLNTPAKTALDIPQRTFTILSHPSENVLRFAMRVHESSFKQSCFALKPQDTVTIFGPKGAFFLQDGKEKIAFLVAGIGITPVIPMLEELKQQNSNRSITLIYSNKSESSCAYHDHLNGLPLDHFKYYPVYTKTNGRLTQEKLSQFLGSFENTHFYIIGTDAFLNSMKNILLQSQVSPENILLDNFG